MLCDFLNLFLKNWMRCKKRLVQKITGFWVWHAHNLKGVSANFNAGELTDLSRQLDECCKTGNCQESGQILANIRDAVESLNNYQTLLQNQLKR